MDFLTELALKSTLFFSFLLLLYYALFQSAARLRHRLLSWGVLVAILLPMLILFLPHWNIPFALSKQEATAFRPTEGSRQESKNDQVLLKEEALAPLIHPVTVDSLPAEIPTPIDWVRLWLGLWLIGTIYFSFRLGYQQWMLRRLLKQTIPIDDKRIGQQSKALMQALRLHRPVHLVMASNLSLPFSWGRSPSHLCLPADYEDWTTEETKATLLHELIHIKSRDYEWHFLLRFAAILYWMHPLYWVIRSYQILERERACDAAVLISGMDSQQYAQQLLAFANRMLVLPEVVLPMARPSDLKRRITTVLDQERWQKQETKYGKASMIVGIMMLGLCLAILYPFASSARSMIAENRPVVSEEEEVLSSAEPPIHTATRSPSDIDFIRYADSAKTESIAKKGHGLIEEISPLMKKRQASFPTQHPTRLLAKALKEKPIEERLAMIETSEKASPGKDLESFILGNQKYHKITNGWSGYPGIGQSFRVVLPKPEEEVLVKNFNFHLRWNYFQEVDFCLIFFALVDGEMQLVGPSKGIRFKIDDQSGWHQVDLARYNIRTSSALIAQLKVEEVKADNGKEGLFFSYAKGTGMSGSYKTPDQTSPLAWYVSVIPLLYPTRSGWGE